MRILSDSNTIYIDTVLRAHQLQDVFSHIATNHAHYEPDGGGVSDDSNGGSAAGTLMHILPYQDPTRPHSCTHCPVNLCKGSVLNEWVAQRGGRGGEGVHKIIYIGDGDGDFCPTLCLEKGDVICCRENWALHEKIVAAGDAVSAVVCPWADGVDLARHFDRHLHSDA